MALPKLLQKLFQNDGVGPLLRSDILPIKTVDGYAPDANGNVDTQRLPLSGGTVSGDVTINGNITVKDIFASGNLNANTSRDFMDMGYPYGYATGALLAIRRYDHPGNPGGFELFARTSDATTSLCGCTDGTLTWGGKEVERVNSRGTKYIRYENGLQICWGGQYVETSNTRITFPAAFNGLNYVFHIQSTYGDSAPGGVSNFYFATGSAISTGIVAKANASNYAVWTAIGYWK